MFKSNFIEAFLECHLSRQSTFEGSFNAFSIVLYKHRKSRKLPRKSAILVPSLYLNSTFCYRYDARHDAENASIWSEDGPRGFGPRAQFNPRDISLRIDNIHANEAGLYRCRLDFKRSQTRNVLVNLTVIGKL